MGKRELVEFVIDVVNRQKYFRSRFLRPFSTSASDLCGRFFCILFSGTLFLIVLACGSPPSGRGAGEIATPAASNSEQNAKQRSQGFRVETVIKALEVPWSIVWTPDGRMFFTERPGRIQVYQNGKLRPQLLFTVPDVAPSGEGGLMSIVLHP
jgi:glucose/arabinose dehydrogenase